jgi:hypothetical protein
MQAGPGLEAGFAAFSGVFGLREKGGLSDMFGKAAVMLWGIRFSPGR